MKTTLLAVAVFCSSAIVLAQTSKAPVSVSQQGDDEVGKAFAQAVRRELSTSSRYRLMPEEAAESGPRFYVELITVEARDVVSESKHHSKSFVSIVIEEMGRPDSYPVAYKWYHKAIIVDAVSVDESARDFLQDMDAAWCRTIRNSVGGCPREVFTPRNGQ